MTDWFAFLDLPRRPGLSDSEIKERYLTLAARYHPDGVTGDDEAFAILQQAYKGLFDPSSRLRHLVALQFPEYQAAATAMPLTDLFMQVGPVLQQAKAVTQKLEKATTTLSRTLAGLEAGEALKKLKAVRQAAEEAGQELAARLIELDRQWPGGNPRELMRWASEWKFLAKWQAELGEWEFRLANAVPGSKVGGA